MKVVVDYDLCEANAVCQKHAPEVFRVEEDDTLTVIISDVPADLQAKVDEAVRLCPRQAIRVED
jgi:ferredoxin